MRPIEIHPDAKEYILKLLDKAKEYGIVPGKDLVFKAGLKPENIYKKINRKHKSNKNLPDWCDKPIPCDVFITNKGVPFARIDKNVKSGFFGSYFRCQNLLTGEIIGVKKQYQSLLGGSDIESENKALQALGALKAKPIIKKRAFWKRDTCYTFLSHIEGKPAEIYQDLFSKFLSPSEIEHSFNELELKRVQSPEFAFLVAVSSLLNLKFIHENRYMHRDINANNILIGGEYSIASIIDFGLAQYLPAGKTYISEMPRAGADFVTPECKQQHKNFWRENIFLGVIKAIFRCYHYKYSQHDDIYALGVRLEKLGIIKTLAQSTKKEYQEFAGILTSMKADSKSDRPASLDEMFIKVNDIFLAEDNKKINKCFTATDRLLSFFFNVRSRILAKPTQKVDTSLQPENNILR